jgi:hypothetical protein
MAANGTHSEFWSRELSRFNTGAHQPLCAKYNCIFHYLEKQKDYQSSHQDGYIIERIMPVQMSVLGARSGRGRPLAGHSLCRDIADLAINPRHCLVRRVRH